MDRIRLYNVLEFAINLLNGKLTSTNILVELIVLGLSKEARELKKGHPRINVSSIQACCGLDQSNGRWVRKEKSTGSLSCFRKHISSLHGQSSVHIGLDVVVPA